jgi:hypothetical protein
MLMSKAIAGEVVGRGSVRALQDET